jgi:hypothetical protein
MTLTGEFYKLPTKFYKYESEKSKLVIRDAWQSKETPVGRFVKRYIAENECAPHFRKAKESAMHYEHSHEADERRAFGNGGRPCQVRVSGDIQTLRISRDRTHIGGKLCPPQIIVT